MSHQPEIMVLVGDTCWIISFNDKNRRLETHHACTVCFFQSGVLSTEASLKRTGKLSSMALVMSGGVDRSLSTHTFTTLACTCKRSFWSIFPSDNRRKERRPLAPAGAKEMY